MALVEYFRLGLLPLDLYGIEYIGRGYYVSVCCYEIRYFNKKTSGYSQPAQHKSLFPFATMWHFRHWMVSRLLASVERITLATPFTGPFNISLSLVVWTSGGEQREAIKCSAHCICQQQQQQQYSSSTYAELILVLMRENGDTCSLVQLLYRESLEPRIPLSHFFVLLLVVRGERGYLVGISCRYVDRPSVQALFVEQVSAFRAG